MAQLRGQTVVLIGGSAGIGLETARLARHEGADVVLVGRDRGRLEQAGTDVGASSTSAFDATDTAALRTFFSDLAGPIDHVMVTRCSVTGSSRGATSCGPRCRSVAW